MRNEAMTGTIFLSPEDSERIRNEIMHPSAEYLHNMQDYFERLASGMTILSQGSNTMVEFKNLDLSSLDALIEEDGVSAFYGENGQLKIIKHEPGKFEKETEEERE